MKDTLRVEAKNRFPDFSDIIYSDSVLANSVWESDISTGKALEILSLLRLINEIENISKKMELNKLYSEKPYCFYSRNEIPLHHGAQAGHEANLMADIPLEERFLSSFTPKATFYGSDGNHWMVFREGNPLHLLFKLIKGDAGYKDRCDIVLVRGAIKEVELSARTVSFCHVDGSQYARYELNVKNSSIIPLKNFDVSSNYSVTTSGVIECSVSKKKNHVDSQLMRYQQLFSTSGKQCSCLFIHGGKAKSKYDTINVDLSKIVSSFDEEYNHLLLSSFVDSCIR